MLFLDKFAFHPPAVDLDSLPFQIHLFQPFNYYLYPFEQLHLSIHFLLLIQFMLAVGFYSSCHMTGGMVCPELVTTICIRYSPTDIRCLRRIRIFGEPTYRILFHIFYVELVVRSTIVPVASTSDKDSLYLRFMCCCFCLFVFLVIHQKLSATD